ncbi:hypothetical protein ACPA0F_18635 [Solibacillus silvestris]
MKKENFMLVFDGIIDMEHINYAVVGVLGASNTLEVIVNPRENFGSKRDYYEKAYNESMELKANTDISVQFIAGLTDLSELQQVVDGI